MSLPFFGRFVESYTEFTLLFYCKDGYIIDSNKCGYTLALKLSGTTTEFILYPINPRLKNAIKESFVKFGKTDYIAMKFKFFDGEDKRFLVKSGIISIIEINTIPELDKLLSDYELFISTLN